MAVARRATRGGPVRTQGLVTFKTRKAAEGTASQAQSAAADNKYRA
jgi:hypothetical protein